jgi:uncharacterized protein (DUF433 family)
MAKTKSYVTLDGHGARRVSGTRVSIDSVVIGFQRGESAEEIQRNFPSLSLEQVYGTIAHYLAHREEVDTYLAQQRAQWNRSRVKAERKTSTAIGRLRKSLAEAKRSEGRPARKVLNEIAATVGVELE